MGIKKLFFFVLQLIFIVGAILLLVFGIFGLFQYFKIIG